MSKKYISQAELGTFCGFSQQFVGKLKKAKLFDEVLDGKKFLRSKATEYAKIIEDNKDLTREPQRIANDLKKNGGGNLEDNKPRKEIPQDNFGMFNVSYLGEEAQKKIKAYKTIKKIKITKKNSIKKKKRKNIKTKK